MTDERLSHVIARLDEALTRLHRAAGNADAPIEPAPVDLVRRHAQLRARTKEAVEALDRLIGRG